MRSFSRPGDIPGLEAVEQALRRAEKSDGVGPMFTVCVCDASGKLLAGATLAGFDQVKLFGRAMVRLGYGADIRGDARMGCDVMFVPRDSVRDIFDDGEPITSPSPL
jgi:hypothetical protein